VVQHLIGVERVGATGRTESFLRPSFAR
jgi:hypothetical protein